MVVVHAPDESFCSGFAVALHWLNSPAMATLCADGSTYVNVVPDPLVGDPPVFADAAPPATSITELPSVATGRRASVSHRAPPSTTYLNLCRPGEIGTVNFQLPAPSFCSSHSPCPVTFPSTLSNQSLKSPATCTVLAFVSV